MGRKGKSTPDSAESAPKPVKVTLGGLLDKEKQALEKGVAGLLEMRKTEGEAIRADLESRLSAVATSLGSRGLGVAPKHRIERARDFQLSSFQVEESRASALR